LIRVAIYADTLVRAQRLAKLLAEDERLEIVQAHAAFRAIEHGPMTDVVVAASMQAEVFAEGPPVVLLSREPPRQAVFTGAVRAWLPDNALPTEISAAVIAAAQDLTVLTQGQARRWLKNTIGDEPVATAEALTPRELQVLRMLADGLGNKQIAAQLAISDHTAKFHVAQILAKLRAGSRTEAVAIGMRRGLVPI
jgi:DNA-binding NarL/FixJ family response regulator